MKKIKDILGFGHRPQSSEAKAELVSDPRQLAEAW